ncbi:hypothetical protein NFI96_000819 [Prochilodus magdalenae]|nr:hypothetical protein NFI96_000819 [Prochilodus magdalenae]
MEDILTGDTLIEYQLLEAYCSKRTPRPKIKPVAYCQGMVCASARPKSKKRRSHEKIIPVRSASFENTDIIERLVELLKKHGDKLNEEIHKDRELIGYLQNSFTYSVFENVASAFISSVVPTSKEKDEQKAGIAWTCEMTSRLGALDLQPMNRVMGFGAQYLHQHFAPWIQRHGGWVSSDYTQLDLHTVQVMVK